MSKQELQDIALYIAAIACLAFLAGFVINGVLDRIAEVHAQAEIRQD